MSRYDEVYGNWQRDPEGFWAEAAEAIDWTKRWDRVLDDSAAPSYRWFVGAETNTCVNAVDRHVAAGRGKQPAIIYDSPVTDTIRAITYAELQDETARCAGMLRQLGVQKGDRVIIYMPMVPETAIAMLACTRIGAIHSVVFGGFASNELATRINDARPKVILSASCGVEGTKVIPYKPLLDGAIDMAKHKPDAVVVLQRPMEQATMVPGRDHDWQEAVAAAPKADPVPVLATDPSYILYTSGTTGEPKGVVRDTGGHLVALKWTMENIYGVQPGECWWAASDVGWVVGHSYIVYAPLFHGATAILFEGKPVGTPDAGVYWRIIQQHKVVALFTAPTAFRAIKKEDPDGALIKKYDLSNFRTLFLAGERADPDTIQWAEQHLQKPVLDHWWQTESGWPMAANPVGLGTLPVKYGSPTKPVPGYDIHIVDEAAKPVPRGTTGAIVVKLPTPPGFLPTLWNAPERFRSAYMEEFPGYYKTADAGYMDEDGYVYIVDRVKDMIISGGENVYSAEVENAIYQHDAVAECAVIGIPHEKWGEQVHAIVRCKEGQSLDEAGLIAFCHELIAGYKCPRSVEFVADPLPLSGAGKILKAELRKSYWAGHEKQVN